jgi:hypothetical protein
VSARCRTFFGIWKSRQSGFAAAAVPALIISLQEQNPRGMKKKAGYYCNGFSFVLKYSG